MKNTRNSDILFSLLLILVLAVCSFLLLFYSVNSYEKVNSGNEITDECHLPYMYLMNKLRSSSDIECKDSEIIITNENKETHIYLYEDGLYELTTLTGLDIDKNAGEKIFDMESFEVSNSDGKINITYVVNGTGKDLTYRIRGGSHE